MPQSTICQGLGFRNCRLRIVEKNRTNSMPTMSATRSAILAVRLTRSCVSSSKAPIAETTRKRSKAESMVGEVLSEMRKRNVITPYTKTCWSLSTPSFCNGDGIASWGRWEKTRTAEVKSIAVVSNLMLKRVSNIRVLQEGFLHCARQRGHPKAEGSVALSMSH